MWNVCGVCGFGLFPTFLFFFSFFLTPLISLISSSWVFFFQSNDPLFSKPYIPDNNKIFTPLSLFQKGKSKPQLSQISEEFGDFLKFNFTEMCSNSIVQTRYRLANHQNCLNVIRIPFHNKSHFFNQRGEEVPSAVNPLISLLPQETWLFLFSKTHGSKSVKCTVLKN